MRICGVKRAWRRAAAAWFLLIILTGCRFSPNSQPKMTYAAEGAETAVSVLRADDLESADGFSNWDIVGISGDLAYGYETPDEGGEAEFGFVNIDGTKQNTAVFGRDSFSGRFVKAVSFDGSVYGIIRENGGDGAFYLFTVNGNLLKILDEIPFDSSSDGGSVSISARGGITVLVSQFEDGHSAKFTTTIYTYSASDGLKERVTEKSEFLDSESRSRGVRLVDCYIDDGSICALGIGKDNDKYLYMLYKYSMAGTFCSSSKIAAFDEEKTLGQIISDPSADMNLYPLNGGFAICSDRCAAVVTDRVVEYFPCDHAWFDGRLAIGGVGDMTVTSEDGAGGENAEASPAGRVYLYGPESVEPAVLDIAAEDKFVPEGLVEAGDSAMIKLRSETDGTFRYYVLDGGAWDEN